MLGKTIHITSEYLAHKEKVVVVGSKVKALKAKGYRLRKDLITAMDDSIASKEKIKALAKELKVEKLLTMQKDEQLQSTNPKLRSWLPKSSKRSSSPKSKTQSCSTGTTSVWNYWGGTW